jgi:hypothetical protein
LDNLQKALFALLYFTNQPDKATATTNRLLSEESKTEYKIRQFLRAAGLFAKDNDSYFIRYFDISRKEKHDVETIISEGKTIPVLFRQPNEIRMRAAYDVLAGWLLKFLYQKYGFIPLRFNSGWGELWCKSEIEKNLNEERIWTEFIDWLPADIAAQSVETLLGIAIERRKRIGSIPFPEPFVRKFGDTIKKVAQRKSFKFQAHQVKEYIKPLEGNTIPPFQFDIKISEMRFYGEECLLCNSRNGIKKLGAKLLLPESKKRFYDIPNIDDNPPICPECFFASMISCLYPSQNYSVCEIPTKEFTETFFLAERTSNLTASLGAMQLSMVSLYSVLPSKYIVVRLNNKKGKLPAKTQLYLLFSEYADSFDVPFIEASVEGAGLLEKLKIDVSILRILGTLSTKVKPPSFVTRDQRGYAANDAIVQLEKGKPYTALYTFGGQALKIGGLYERTIFKSPYTFEDFDKAVSEQSGLLIKRLTGGDTMLKQNPKEFYEDVKGLSESLYDIIQPLAQDEVKSGGSKVSVVVRKYTDHVATDFPKLNLENFQYWVAKKADDIEKAGGGYPPKSTIKKQLEQLEDDIVGKFYKKYFEDSNAYLWRQFMLEVNARLLSKLLLNVHARKEG